VGTRDKHFTIELGRRLAAAFRHAQIDEVADATTFVSIDRPGAVASAVRDVLAKLRGETGRYGSVHRAGLTRYLGTGVMLAPVVPAL
jgi:hypothetical protein